MIIPQLLIPLLNGAEGTDMERVAIFVASLLTRRLLEENAEDTVKSLLGVHLSGLLLSPTY